jgi:hypothetical protein
MDLDALRIFVINIYVVPDENTLFDRDSPQPVQERAK